MFQVMCKRDPLLQYITCIKFHLNENKLKIAT